MLIGFIHRHFALLLSLTAFVVVAAAGTMLAQNAPGKHHGDNC